MLDKIVLYVGRRNAKVVLVPEEDWEQEKDLDEWVEGFGQIYESGEWYVSSRHIDVQSKDRRVLAKIIEAINPHDVENRSETSVRVCLGRDTFGEFIDLMNDICWDD
jgi:hypothetical protein